MGLELFIGLLLTLLPISELRGGLPIVIHWALKNNYSVFPYFFLVVGLNVIMIFLIILFLDYLHEEFMKIKIYRKVIEKYLEKVRKKADKIEKKIDNVGFIALCLFVAIPFPGTGAWTGSFVSWVLGLNRKKSIIAIGAGVLIAGVLILISSLGLFSLF